MNARGMQGGALGVLAVIVCGALGLNVGEEGAAAIGAAVGTVGAAVGHYGLRGLVVLCWRGGAGTDE
jgi:hypothetical protein